MRLKPASPTPSNAGSSRSFQTDTDWRIKVLRYCEVLHQGGAWVYRCATRAPHVTRTGTYCPSRTPLRESVGLHLFLYSIHSIATDRRWTMSYSSTPQLEKWHHWLHGPVVLNVHRQLSTALQNSTPKLAGQNPETISQDAIYREHSPGLPQDNKSLRSSSGSLCIQSSATPTTSR